MTDVLKSLFGGSSSQSNQISQSTPQNYTAAPLSGLAPDLASSLRETLVNFSNKRDAGPQSTPQAAMTGQEGNLINTINSQVGPGTDSAKYIKDVLSGSYLPGQANSNPFFADAVKAAQRPTLEGLTETLGRVLPGRFTQAGQMIQSNAGDQGGSSAFDRAGAIATRGVANAVGDIATNMGNTQFQNERSQQTQAAALDQGQVDQTIKALQASALPRLIEQNGLDKGLALFQSNVANLLDVLKTIGAVAAPTMATGSASIGESSSSSEKGIIPGLFPKGFSGGGSGGS